MNQRTVIITLKNEKNYMMLSNTGKYFYNIQQNAL